MADVVQYSSEAQQLDLAGIYELQVSLLCTKCVDGRRKILDLLEDAESVFEPRVDRAGINPMDDSQLPNETQTLYQRAVN